MKIMLRSILIIAACSVFTSLISYSQKSNTTVNQILSSDLESHVSFLASPLLKGRMNGDDGLEIASRYIASQVQLFGLKPANGESYFQPYSIERKSIDIEKTIIRVLADNEEPVTIKVPVLQWLPDIATDFSIEEEVIFAGYGIKSDKYNYNDFENLGTVGIILLVMNRAPLSEDGKTFLFEGTTWSSFMNIQLKLTSLMSTKAKAILIVMDPKSGFASFEEQYPGIAGQLKSVMNLKGSKPPMIGLPGMTNTIFIHRAVADELLKGTGHTLEELQRSIDSSLRPHSFVIPGKRLMIHEVSLIEEKTISNIAAYVEGSDPVLKDEVIIYSAHVDHVGETGGKVYPGADDNASGCAALLEIADAFSRMEKKPLRSILFLWVSGEEIGLYGSKYYAEHPLFPLEKTVVNLNADMIGRIKGVADTADDNHMTGPSTVFTITCNQSRDLLTIAGEVDKKTPLGFDYSLSGRDNPLQLFSRSDHYNFVRKDIPVIFFTTGIHADYHSPDDVIERIDFNKMELVSRAMYETGLSVANRRNRIVVDNPFSKW
jgi:hypothetical protein